MKANKIISLTIAVFLLLLGGRSILAQTLPSFSAASVTGEFSHIVVDNFKEGTARDEYFVKDQKTGQRFQLTIPSSSRLAPAPAKTGDTITVSGLRLGDKIISQAKDIKVTARASERPSSPLASGDVDEKKIAVILFNWQNDTREPFTPDQIRDWVFTDSDSVNAFYQENSFGKMKLVGKNRPDGDVYGWFTLPLDHLNNEVCAGLITTTDLVDTYVQTQGLSLSGYDIVIHVFPGVFCAWSGYSSVGGSPAFIMIDWVPPLTDAHSFSLRVIGHEIGHALGTIHAGFCRFLDTEGRPLSILPLNSTGRCSDQNWAEYGDPFDIMGSGRGHMISYRKGYAGTSEAEKTTWLNDDNTVTFDRATGYATYDIFPLEFATNNVQTLRIPILGSRISGQYNDNTTYPSYYYVEFRKPVGFEVGNNVFYDNSVLIHIATDYGLISRSLLIDTTPGSNSFPFFDALDASLKVGQSFIDPYENIMITNQAMSPDFATIRVEVLPVVGHRDTGFLLYASTAIPAGARVKVYDPSSGRFVATLYTDGQGYSLAPNPILEIGKTYRVDFEFPRGSVYQNGSVNFTVPPGTGTHIQEIQVANRPSITITKPTTGDVYYLGSDQPLGVKWSTSGVPSTSSVSFGVYADGGTTSVLSTSVPNTGYSELDIASLTPGRYYISAGAINSSGGWIGGQSGTFIVSVAPLIVTAPMADAVLDAGQPITVSWVYPGLSPNIANNDVRIWAQSLAPGNSPEGEGQGNFYHYRGANTGSHSIPANTLNPAYNPFKILVEVVGAPGVNGNSGEFNVQGGVFHPKPSSVWPRNKAIDARIRTGVPFRQIDFNFSQPLPREPQLSDIRLTTTRKEGRNFQIGFGYAGYRHGSTKNFSVFFDNLNPREQIEVEHLPSATLVRLGYLPGDVNQSGTTNAQDIAYLADCLNGSRVCENYQSDINDSGSINAQDMTQLIDLLNGNSSNDPWTNVSLFDFPTKRTLTGGLERQLPQLLPAINRLLRLLTN